MPIITRFYTSLFFIAMFFVITAYVIGEPHKTLDKVNIFDDNVVRQVQIRMCNVPDCPYPIIYQEICNFNRLVFRDGQYSNLDIVILDKVFQLIHHTNRHASV